MCVTAELVLPIALRSSRIRHGGSADVAWLIQWDCEPVFATCNGIVRGLGEAARLLASLGHRPVPMGEWSDWCIDVDGSTRAMHLVIPHVQCTQATDAPSFTWVCTRGMHNKRSRIHAKPQEGVLSGANFAALKQSRMENTPAKLWTREFVGEMLETMEVLPDIVDVRHVDEMPRHVVCTVVHPRTSEQVMVQIPLSALVLKDKYTWLVQSARNHSSVPSLYVA